MKVLGCLALLGAGLCLAGVTAGAEGFQAGFARTDLTPAVGAQMPGGYNEHISKGVRDPLFAEAAVFSSGDTTVAVVGVDLIMIPRAVVLEARRLAEARCGVPGGNILVGASHTHTGGPIVDCFGSTSDPAYSRFAAERIAEAVCLAHAARVEARLATASGEARGVAFNRRFFMKDGSVITHPGKMNPDILKPAEPVDAEVGLIAAEDLDGNLLGCVVNHAMHGTTIGGSEFSADWPYFLRKTVRGGAGADIGVVFLNGACGDVTQVNNQAPGSDFGERSARLIGMTVGGEVLKLLAGAEFAPDATVAVVAEEVALPIRDFVESDDEIVDREAPPFGLGSGAREMYLREAGMVRAMRGASPVVNEEIQALRVGNAVIVSNPTEFFSALGLAIKEGQPWKPVMVAELANGYAGYAPTREAYEQGGYEPRTARSSFLAPGTGEQIVEVSRRLLAALAEGK